jgi:glycerol kinase
VQKAVEEDNCRFGTVDTWLLHKLTKGEGSDSWTQAGEIESKGLPEMEKLLPTPTVLSHVTAVRLFGTLRTPWCSKGGFISDLL